MHAVRKRGSALPSGFVHNLVSSGESSAFFNSDGTNCFSRQLTRMRVYFKPDATSASLRCAGKANRDHLGGRRREASFVRSHNPDARSEATWLSMKLRRKMDAGGGGKVYQVCNHLGHISRPGDFLGGTAHPRHCGSIRPCRHDHAGLRPPRQKWPIRTQRTPPTAPNSV